MNNKEYDQHIINFHTQLLVSMLSTGKVVNSFINEKNIEEGVKLFTKSFNENIATKFLDEKKEQIKNIDDFNEYPEQFLIHCKSDLRKMKEEFIEKKVKQLFSQFDDFENNLEEMNANKGLIKSDILNVVKTDIKENAQTVIKEIAQLFKEVITHFKNNDSIGQEDALLVLAKNIVGISSTNQELKNLKEVFTPLTTMERVLVAELLENCNLDDSNNKDYNKSDYNQIFNVIGMTFEKYNANNQKNRMY